MKSTKYPRNLIFVIWLLGADFISLMHKSIDKFYELHYHDTPTDPTVKVLSALTGLIVYIWVATLLYEKKE